MRGLRSPGRRPPLEADVDHAVARLEIVEHEIHCPVGSAGRGGDIHARDDLLAIDRDRHAVADGILETGGGELQPRVVLARPDGHVDREFPGVDAVTIKIRVGGARDRTRCGLGPPRARHAVGPCAQADDELRAGPPEIAGRITVVLTAGVSKDHPLRLGRPAPCSAVRAALGIGPCRTVEIDTGAPRERVLLTQGHDLQRVRRVRQAIPFVEYAAAARDRIRRRLPAIDAGALLDTVELDLGEAAIGPDLAEQPDPIPLEDDGRRGSRLLGIVSIQPGRCGILA